MTFQTVIVGMLQADENSTTLPSNKAVINSFFARIFSRIFPHSSSEVIDKATAQMINRLELFCYRRGTIIGKSNDVKKE